MNSNGHIVVSPIYERATWSAALLSANLLDIPLASSSRTASGEDLAGDTIRVLKYASDVLSLEFKEDCLA